MESIYPEFVLYGSKNECARIDTEFSSQPEVSTRAVTLEGSISYTCSPQTKGQHSTKFMTVMTKTKLILSEVYIYISPFDS